jgi:uncharacterized membrane protein
VNPVSGTPEDPTFPLAAHLRMAGVLRAGLYAALALLGGALVAHLLLNPGSTSASVIASNPILAYLNVPGLVSGLAHGTPAAYLTLGLLVLVATPILRVLTGMYYFRRGGERTMVAITATVTLLIFAGLLVIGPLLR